VRSPTHLFTTFFLYAIIIIDVHTIPLKGGKFLKIQSSILLQAEQEVSETGKLSFATRRKLWLEFGPWEARKEDDPVPRTLTEPLKKRAELALACAKKVSRIWSAYDSEDKRPQKLIKETRAYLDGRRTPEQLSETVKIMEHFMSIVENEPDSSAPAAGMSAWNALITALHDEPLLEERYADATDSDLDCYDWDAAREASEAWTGANEEASPGQRKVRRMKFWAWYLEQSAKLLGDSGYCFPAKAIKAYQLKQNPPKPVPAEVSLESLADYLELGTFRYCCRILAKLTLYDDAPPNLYQVVYRHNYESAVCPKCKSQTKEIKYYIGGAAAEGELPGGVSFRAIEEIPFFRCPDHPDEWINVPHEYINRKAIFKKYIAGTGRAETLKKQIEERAVNRFEVSERSITLNDRSADRFMLQALDGGTPGLEWTNREDDSFSVDLAVFGPNVAFLDLPYEEFAEKYPQRVRKVEERVTEIDFAGVWVRCYLDKKGDLLRVETTNRFQVELKSPKKDKDKLTAGLAEALGIPVEQAQGISEVLGQMEYARGKEVMDCLSGFSRKEAERVLKILRSHRVECRIMPWLIDKEGDAW
jgi:hypothetical protein